MGRWSVAMAGVVAVLIASSCSDGAGRWGEEAVAYVDAFDQARSQSIVAELPFYAPDHVFDDPASVGDWTVERERVAGVIGVLGDFAIDRTGLAIESRLGSEGEPGPVVDMLTDLELDSSGLIASVTQAWAVEDTTAVSVGQLYVEGARAARDLVAAYVEAWSSAEPVRIAALYDSYARIEDSLLGIELEGATAIRSFVAGRTPSQAAGLELRTTPDGGDAVYVRWPDGVNDLLAHRIEVTVAFASDDGTGCPDRTVAKLSIANGQIIDERRYHDVDDLRRCVSTDQLPEGWWTGLEPPSPPTADVTGVVEVDGQVVEVRNGTGALHHLAAWGFERFVAAGLSAPAVELVSFEEYVPVEHCAGRHHGLAIKVDGAMQLYLCVGEEDACTDARCREFRSKVRQDMLHEIGHAWLDEHVGPDTEQAFVELMGLQQWRGESIPWGQRGVEQAANVLMWGVMESQMDEMRGRTCDELAAAFELLTGEQPQQPCAQAANR